MPNITQHDFSGGWRPSDDNINGAPNGFLQMDNVDLDTNGAISLIGGTALIGSAYSANLHSIASYMINGVRVNYSCDTAGNLFRDNTSIGSSGSTSRAAFSVAYDYTLICSGNKRLKDNGTAAVNLGVVAPTAALTYISSDLLTDAPFQVFGSLLTNYVMNVGTSAVITEANFPTGGGHARPAPIQYLQLTADVAGVVVAQSKGIGPYDMTVMTSPYATDVGTGTDDDLIPLYGYVENPFGASLQIDVLLVNPNIYGDQVSDYYTYKVEDLSNLQFDAYTGVFQIFIKRSDFTRVGSGTQTWTTTYGFRITFKGTNAQVINILGNSINPAVASGVFIFGGSHAQNGIYEFAQVNVNNTGTYLAKSTLGPSTGPISIINSQAYLVAQNPSDSQVNEVWIFARSAGGVNSVGGFSTLDQWYRVAKLTSAFTTNFHVRLSDLSALTLNIKFNSNLISIASGTITDPILAIVGPLSGRWYYFTKNLMYPSEINNPDLVDSSIAIRLTGSNNEIFLWAKQVDKATVLIGTSLDVYVLSGTFATLPDYSIDVFYHGLGCKYPPITWDADVWSGNVYYLANDGWRIINANHDNPLIVAPELDRLYKGIDCYTYTAPNLKVVPGTVRFPVVVAKNKLWCFITGTSRCEVFDFIRKYWRTFNYSLGDVLVATSTQDGQVLVFYSSDKKLREIDVKGTKLIDGATKQNIKLLWTVRDGGLPRNRKDSQTFKVRCYSGTSSFLVTITNDLNAVGSPGSITSTGRGLDKFLDLSQVLNLSMVKTYQLALTGLVDDLLIEDWSIDFTSRPEQVSFIRTLPNNYGTTAYKRVFGQPLQIDTLGNNVTLTPYLDGAAAAGLVLNSTRKQSFTYEYSLVGTDILKARDYEYLLSSTGLFEFYGFEEPRNIEVFPEPRLTHILPVTNFGNPNKKRLRVWPFVVDSKGGVLTFTPIVDQIAHPELNAIFSHDGRKIVLAHYTNDIFGIDYSGYWTCTNEWEFWEALPPTIVQILPVAKRFDQVGPEELFRYGKIAKIELRVLPFGAQIPITVYMSDNVKRSVLVDTTNGQEDSYFIDMPKGVSGRIARIVFGPTNFDFHRFYVRLQVADSGKDTELNWITIAND